MSDGDQITHLVGMVYMAVDSAHNSVVAESGFLNRLQKEIDSGGFAADGTLEIVMLEKSEKYLRQTADAIEKARLQLLSNHRMNINYKNSPRVIFSGEPF